MKEMISMTKKNMREAFKGLNLYSKESYEDIWENATIVLDTNILLNLFRYSKDTRKKFFTVLNSYKSRLWLPYQVIREYYKNRDKVIKDSTKEIVQLEKIIKDKLDDILTEVKKYNKKIQSIDDLKKIIEKTEKDTDAKIKNLKENNESIGTLEEENIKIESDILDLIEDKYEEKYEYENIEEIIKEGDRRIQNQCPPGYKDIEKSERYKDYQVNGDYLIFDSIITYAKENKKSIIFITDDVKEDWFQEVNGEKNGGRKELLQEFYEKTNQLLLIYSSEGFINYYNKGNPGQKVSEEIVKEIEIINKDKEWISSIEKGENVYNKKFYRSYSLNKELSDSEKIKCIRDLKDEVIHLSQINSIDTREKRIINIEILELVKKIRKYEVERYIHYFERIQRLTNKLIIEMERENYYTFDRYLNIILEIIDDIH